MSDPVRQDPSPDGPPTTSVEDSAMAGKETSVASTRRKLPGFLDHFNARDLKVVFRCSVAAWVASLLIFINPSLHEVGTATFFAAYVNHVRWVC